MGARAAAAALALAVTLVLPGGAEAGFPGRDGLIAFTRTVGGERGQIHVVRPDGSGLRQLTRRRNGAGGASWSPDGRRIAFGARAHGELHIFVKRLGGRTRRITPRGANFSTMAWSPDGRRIAAASGHWVQGRRYFDETLVVMRTDGRRPRTVYNGGQLGADAPAWSPDGRTIAFMHTDVGALGASPSIYVVPAAGGEARRITEDSAQDHPDWSPDGSLIAYSYGSALGTDAVRVMRPDGTATGSSSTTRLSRRAGRRGRRAASGSPSRAAAGSGPSPPTGLAPCGSPIRPRTTATGTRAGSPADRPPATTRSSSVAASPAPVVPA